MSTPLNRLPTLVLGACVALAATTARGQTTCPPYTHKDTVIIGSPADLPNGFMLFAQGNLPGLYRSPLKSYSPQIVPGTEKDIPRSIDISDDGAWAVYTSGTVDTRGQFTVDSAYLVGLEKPVHTGIPLYRPQVKSFNRLLNDTVLVSIDPAVVGFNHGSPKGDEIWCYGWSYRGDGEIHAVPVTLTGDTPVFGADRLLLDLDTAVDKRRLWPYTGPNTGAVVKDHIFALFASINPTKHVTIRGDTMDGGLSWAIYNDYVTIPDGGNGTAGPVDFYHWTNPPDSAQLWGCGQTMSRDGALCLTNTNSVGSACVPNTNQTPAMDHKGFFITPFFRSDDPPMAMNKQVDSAGVSINWCPVPYRVGAHGDCGFSQWCFANNSDYVIGESEGAMAPALGLWVVQWKTNTWTLVTPNAKTVLYSEPAIFITDPSSSVKGPARGARATTTAPLTALLGAGQRTVMLRPGFSRVSVFSLSGRQLWQYQRNTAERLTQVHLPASIRQTQALVRLDR